jgi:hypothetical protein
VRVAAAPLLYIFSKMAVEKMLIIPIPLILLKTAITHDIQAAPLVSLFVKTFQALSSTPACYYCYCK